MTSRGRICHDGREHPGSAQAILAMACGGRAESPDGVDEARCQRLAPGESEVVAVWTGAETIVWVDDIAAGSACDLFVAGFVAGRVELGGQTLESGGFLADREASGELDWVRSWPDAAVDWLELAPAPDGGVWAAGQTRAPTDFGDGVLHPVEGDTSVLVRYAVDGSLGVLRVDAHQRTSALASDTTAHRASRIAVDGESTRLELLDDSAEIVWTAPLPSQSFNNIALGADGSVFTSSEVSLGASSLLQHYDAAGALLWVEAATGRTVRSVGSLPGAAAFAGSRCPNTVGLGLGCDEESFVQLVDATGVTRFEVTHDLGAGAFVTPNDPGPLLLIGADSSAARLALQQIGRDGRFGAHHLFAWPATRDVVGGAASGHTVWVAGSTWRDEVIRGDGTVTGFADGFLLEMGL